MRPPAPGRFRRTLLERAGLTPGLSPAARMALRNLERRPVRAVLGTLGLASATGILVTGAYFDDAVAWMLRGAFEDALRGDVTVTFVQPESPESVLELARLQGVTAAEPTRSAAAILRHGSRRQTLALTGVPPASDLSRGGGAAPRGAAPRSAPGLRGWRRCPRRPSRPTSSASPSSSSVRHGSSPAARRSRPRRSPRSRRGAGWRASTSPAP